MADEVEARQAALRLAHDRESALFQLSPGKRERLEAANAEHRARFFDANGQFIGFDRKPAWMLTMSYERWHSLSFCTSLQLPLDFLEVDQAVLRFFWLSDGSFDAVVNKIIVSTPHNIVPETRLTVLDTGFVIVERSLARASEIKLALTLYEHIKLSHGSAKSSDILQDVIDQISGAFSGHPFLHQMNGHVLLPEPHWQAMCDFDIFHELSHIHPFPEVYSLIDPEISNALNRDRFSNSKNREVFLEEISSDYAAIARIVWMMPEEKIQHFLGALTIDTFIRQMKNHIPFRLTLGENYLKYSDLTNTHFANDGEHPSPYFRLLIATRAVTKIVFASNNDRLKQGWIDALEKMQFIENLMLDVWFEDILEPTIAPEIERLTDFNIRKTYTELVNSPNFQIGSDIANEDVEDYLKGRAK